MSRSVKHKRDRYEALRSLLINEMQTQNNNNLYFTRLVSLRYKIFFKRDLAKIAAAHTV